MQKKKKKEKRNTFDSNLRYSICIISLSTVRLCDQYEELQGVQTNYTKNETAKLFKRFVSAVYRA